MAKIYFEGLEDLHGALKEKVTMKDVKEVVAFHGDKLNTRMKEQTKESFKKGYSHGDTASSINTNMIDNGLTAEVGATMEYDEYVENGTRFMDAEPFVEPAFNEQKELFKRDMKKLVR